MLEVGIEEVMAMSDFKVGHPSERCLSGHAGELTSVHSHQGIKSAAGAVPLFHFSAVEPHANLWETHPTFTQFKSILLDFFRGNELDGVALKGLERVISVTIGGTASDEANARAAGTEAANNGGSGKGKAVESLIGAIPTGGATTESWDEDNSLPVVHFRTYTAHFMRSGLPQPRVELSPHGPHFTFSLRRSQLPTAEVWKQAMKKKEKKSTNGPKKSKNVDVSIFRRPPLCSVGAEADHAPHSSFSPADRRDGRQGRPRLRRLARPRQAPVPKVQGTQAQAGRVGRRCRCRGRRGGCFGCRCERGPGRRSQEAERGMREEGVSVPLFLRHLFFFPISPSRGSLFTLAHVRCCKNTVDCSHEPR